MTIFQILALVLAGPVVLISVGQLIRAVLGRTEFHIVQGLLLMVAVAVILVAFLGIQ